MRRIAVSLLVLVSGLGPAAAQSAPPKPPAPSAPVIETLPVERGGQDLIGAKLPRLIFDHWINPIDRIKLRKPASGRPALYRWWTDTCPYCEASLPAFDKLRRKYPDLDVVGVYHPKPAREVRRRDVGNAAVRLGYEGIVAIDKDWSELRRAYLDHGKRGATSISILVDREGVVRFVHPGPVLFPSDDPEHAQENADFELLEKAVKAVLAETPSPTKAWSWRSSGS